MVLWVIRIDPPFRLSNLLKNTILEEIHVCQDISRCRGAPQLLAVKCSDLGCCPCLRRPVEWICYPRNAWVSRKDRIHRRYFLRPIFSDNWIALSQNNLTLLMSSISQARKARGPPVLSLIQFFVMLCPNGKLVGLFSLDWMVNSDTASCRPVHFSPPCGCTWKNTYQRSSDLRGRVCQVFLPGMG